MTILLSLAALIIMFIGIIIYVQRQIIKSHEKSYFQYLQKTETERNYEKQNTL